MHDVPADAAVALCGRAAGEVPATSGADAPELLGVEVDEVPGVRPAVAHHRLARLQSAQAAEAQAAQHRVDARAGHAGEPADPVRSDAQPQAQGDDAPQQGAADALRWPPAGRGAIGEAGKALEGEAAAPLARRLTADAGGRSRLDDLPAFVFDALAEQLAAVQAETRVTMSHEGPPSVHGLGQPQTDRQGPSPVNNVDGCYS